LRAENAELRIYCTNSVLRDDLFFFFYGLLLSLPWTFGCDVEEDQNERGKAEDVKQELEQRKLLIGWKAVRHVDSRGTFSLNLGNGY